MEPDKSPRTLTDEDIQALIDELESRLEKHVGKGMISLLWKAALLGFLFLAGLGILKEGKFF